MRRSPYAVVAVALLAIALATPVVAQEELKIGPITEPTIERPVVLGGPPANDLCSAPIALSCNGGTGGTVTGSTLTATDDSAVAPTCGVSVNAPGVWYAVQGNGGDIRLNTCFPTAMGGTTDYDTKLTVYTSDCADLSDNCVLGNDDGSPNGLFPDPMCVIPETGSTDNRASFVEFPSLDAQEYLVLVHGFGGFSGNFTLGIDCDVPVELTGFDID